MAARGPSGGSMSLQLLVVMVPVMFGLMGFAVDLGRLYLIRGELNQAASAMAMAAAGKLIGTQQSLDNATAAAQLSLDDGTGHANKYNFGSLVIGQTTGLLSSQVNAPAYFSTLAAALGTSTAGGDQADGTTARHVQVNLTGDAPLLFWSALSLGQSRTTPIAAQAVAGISAPVCSACGVEPFAIAAFSQDDATDFGFTQGSLYTFAYQCQSTPPSVPPPSPLAGGGPVIQYTLLDHYDSGSALDESQQLYRIGAQGLLPPSVSSAPACININGTETMWASARPVSCNSAPTADMIAVACGIYSRFDLAPPSACSAVTDVDTLSQAYQPDADTSSLDDYTAYTGNTRRVITVPVVDALSATDPMTILGFRQFLIEPNQGDVVTNPSDQNGRFAAMYIGSPVPVKQGRIDGPPGGPSCQITAGPGKVVLHQ